MKKRKSKIFGVFLIILALIIMQLPRSEAFAATNASDFKIDGGKLVSFLGTAANVSIPTSVEVIGRGAFENNHYVEKVTISSSVKKIEAYAFWGADNLSTVTLGKNLKTVDDYAFANCKGLTSMTIPTNITSIGIYSFEDCVNLTDIYIPNSVTDIHDTAFDGCYNLTIHADAGSYADKYAKRFYERQKENPEYQDTGEQYPTVIEIPSTDTGDTGNTGDTGMTVTIPEPEQTATPGFNYTIPGDGVYNGSETAIVPDNPSNGDYLVQDEFGRSRVVGNHAVVFIDNTKPTVYSGAGASVNDIEIGDTEITEIPSLNNGSGDFVSKYSKYTIVDDSVIADLAYYRNDELETYEVPDGIYEIGEFAFARSSLTGIIMPDTIRSIDYGAFYHCDNLGSVYLPAEIESIAPKAFDHTLWVDTFLQSGVQDEPSFLISNGSLIAYKGSSSSVTIPDGVRLIAGEVFKDHTEITSVSFPDTVEIVGEGAFEGCLNLSDIALSGRLSVLKDRAFRDTGIDSVTLPSSLTEYGILVFDDDADVNMGSASPARTHELSAERLSNAEYRGIDSASAGTPGVNVVGIDGVRAQLEGANRPYTLNISQSMSDNDISEAFTRALNENVPADAKYYLASLTDSSGINISKLGKQYLHIEIPVPDEWQSTHLSAVTVDRNGQLEEVLCERVRADGNEYIRINTSHLSPFAIFPDGEPFSEADLIEEETFFESSAAPAMSITAFTTLETPNGIPYAWILAGAFAGIGLVFLLKKSRE